MAFVVLAARRAPTDRLGRAEPARRLGGLPPGDRRLERTTAGELQGVLDDAAEVVDVVLALVRVGGWRIGVGAGPLRATGPEPTRAGPGPAYLSARRAFDAAERRPVRLAVRGVAPADAGDAQAVLTALAVLVERRSGPAWEAIELVLAGRTQVEAAAILGISRQAVGQRLAAGFWDLERELRPTAGRLLTRAAG